VAGSDVAVSNVVVQNETTITATLTPDLGAPTGARTIMVTLPGTGPGVLTGSTGVCLVAA